MVRFFCRFGFIGRCFKRKLENTYPGSDESLSDYILRFSSYFDHAHQILETFSLSESACCRLFLNSLRCKAKLYAEMIRANARRAVILEHMFQLARDCLSDVRAIEKAECFFINSRHSDRGYDYHRSNSSQYYSYRDRPHRSRSPSVEEGITRSGLRSSDISSERRRVHFNNDRNRDDRQFARNNSRPSTDQSARSSTTFPTDKRRPLLIPFVQLINSMLYTLKMITIALPRLFVHRSR